MYIKIVYLNEYQHIKQHCYYNKIILFFNSLLSEEKGNTIGSPISNNISDCFSKEIYLFFLFAIIMNIYINCNIANNANIPI